MKTNIKILLHWICKNQRFEMFKLTVQILNTLFRA